jgi:hypothetical protein
MDTNHQQNPITEVIPNQISKTSLACTCEGCLAKATENPKKYWKYVGTFYGYPECCIRAFICQAAAKRRPSRERSKAAKNGFVPCLKHSREILKGNITIESLLSPNRLCPMPLDAPFYADPYIELLIGQSITSIAMGIPLDIIQSAIQFVHVNLSEEILKECKEKYEQLYPPTDITSPSRTE